MPKDEPEKSGGLPSWYEEIFPAAPHDGFFHKFGSHAACFVDRGEGRLVVSFDNLSDAGYPHPDIEPWGGDFIRQNGWSHLGVFSRGPTWYRDPEVIGFLEKLRDEGFLKRFKGVSLIGTSMGGFAALTFSSLAPGAVVVALSPQSTLDSKILPWEERFQKGQAQDWSLPYSDAAEQTAGASKVYVLYDPFFREDRRHIDRLPQDNVIHLKGFGFGHKSAVFLRRMEQLKPVMKAAIEGELTAAEFYGRIRDRKNIYIYRRSIEQHLTDRGHDAMIPGFVRAFQRRRRKLAVEADAAQATAPAPSRPASNKPDGLATSAALAQPVSPAEPVRWPEGVNAWMVEQHGHKVLYMSDRYRGAVMGFEEQDGITLAQTHPLALGVLSYGAVSPAARILPEPFTYHLLDETLSGHGADIAARAKGAALLSIKQAASRPLKTVVALSEIQPGISEAEAGSGTPGYQAILDRVTTARDGLTKRGKRLFVDRISLRLLAGAPETPERAAKAHYVQVARSLRADVPAVTGQGSFPVCMVTQSAGSRTDGRSEVILAEGRLEWENPTTGFVVATPSYPFKLMEGMAATIAPEDQLVIDELEALAVSALQRGLKWHCPALRYARMNKAVITAEFSAMNPLIREKGKPHGFALEGCENGAKIRKVEVEGFEARITLSKIPQGPGLYLTYAWGMQADGSKDRFANQGGVREDWSEPSVLAPEHTLHRYALAGRVKVNKDIKWP